MSAQAGPLEERDPYRSCFTPSDHAFCQHANFLPVLNEKADLLADHSEIKYDENNVGK